MHIIYIKIDKTGKHVAVLIFFQVFFSSPHQVIKNVLCALRYISRVEIVKANFAAYQSLFATMDNYLGDEVVQDAALSFLFNLCSTVVNKQTVATSQGV